MTSDQKRIIAAATNASSTTTFEEIESKISTETGIEVLIVREMLASLVNEGVLTRCVTKPRNVLEEPDARNEPTRVWYELASFKT